MGKLIIGVNDLASQHPSVAKELDSIKSGFTAKQVARASNKKAWFTCPQGHSYQTIISYRTIHNCGCPYHQEVWAYFYAFKYIRF